MKIVVLKYCLVWGFLGILPWLTADSGWGAEEKGGVVDQFESTGWKWKSEITGIPSETKVETGSQKPISIITLDSPGITEPNHLVAGEIRFQDVAGTGYLEMWTVYEGDERYFSRTMGESGPMAKLSGNAEWRLVMLPFQGLANRQPIKLEINVVLPGGGTVEFRDFHLFEAGASPMAGWISPARVTKRAVTAMAILAGLLGVAVWLSVRGKARNVSLGLAILVGLTGLSGMVMGLILAPRALPAAWITLVACGLVALLAGIGGFLVFRKVYLKHELRQISAVDCAP